MADKKEKVGFFTRVGNFFRKMKSEFGKIVWSPFKQVRKNTAVVVVVIIAFAVMIGVLDWVFSETLGYLAKLL